MLLPLASLSPLVPWSRGDFLSRLSEDDLSLDEEEGFLSLITQLMMLLVVVAFLC